MLPDDGARGAERLTESTRRLFDVLDLSIFRVWSMPGIVAEETESIAVRLRQTGTDHFLASTFIERLGRGWRLAAPPLRTLEQLHVATLEARGDAHIIPGHDLTLPHPRGTMRAFIEGVHDWDGGGRAQVASTFDLSDVPPRLRDFEIDLLADYLRRIIDRVGFVTWQELPDDPRQTLPYVHFVHPAGEITIAPVRVDEDGVADGTVRWLFTTETLRDLPALYDAVQELEPPHGLRDA